MKIGYRRVSTSDQNPARQLEGISLDCLYTDFATGSTLNRPHLQAMLTALAPGDVLYIHSLDRLGRNLRELQKLVDEILAKKVEIRFLKENLIFNGSQSLLTNLMFQMLGSFAEFERAMIKERQKEGIAIAKAKGVYQKKPRHPPELIEEALRLVELGVTKSNVARKLNMPRSSIYFYMKEIERKKIHTQPQSN